MERQIPSAEQGSWLAFGDELQYDNRVIRADFMEKIN